MSKSKYFVIGAFVLIFSFLSYFVLGSITRADVNVSGTEVISPVSPGAITIIPKEEQANENDEKENDSTYPLPDQTDTEVVEEVPFTPATELDLDPESITVFVNKEYALPKDYVPKDLKIPNVLFETPGYEEKKHMRKEAADALEDLFHAASKDGVTLYAVSGYRSYERQYKIFTYNIWKKGKKHTLKYSAVPGTSEHQTGLSMDVSIKSIDLKLVTSFSTSKEGIWLSENAYKFGYIIRYPLGKEKQTGYEYEPWHIRYVGKDLAKYLQDNDMILEDYYNYQPSKDFNFEVTYADLINYVPPTPTPTPTPTPSPTPTPTPTITPELTPSLTPTPLSGEDGGEDNGDVEGEPPIEGENGVPGENSGLPDTGLPGEPSDNNLPDGGESHNPSETEETPKPGEVINLTPTPIPTPKPINMP